VALKINLILFAVVTNRVMQTIFTQTHFYTVVLDTHILYNIYLFHDNIMINYVCRIVCWQTRAKELKKMKIKRNKIFLQYINKILLINIPIECVILSFVVCCYCCYYYEKNDQWHGTKQKVPSPRVFR